MFLDLSETDVQASEDPGDQSEESSGEDHERQPSPVATKKVLVDDDGQGKHKKEAAKAKDVEKEKEKDDKRGRIILDLFKEKL